MTFPQIMFRIKTNQKKNVSDLRVLAVQYFLCPSPLKNGISASLQQSSIFNYQSKYALPFNHIKDLLKSDPKNLRQISI